MFRSAIYPPRPSRRATRIAAVASLIGAAALCGPVGVEAATLHHHGMGRRTAAQARETVENRITMLHSQLAITSDEESKWSAVAQVMRDNEADMQRLVAQRRAESPQELTAVQDLKTYERFNQAHVNGLKNLISSFEILYGAMPAAQQAVADQVFHDFGRHHHSMKS